MAVIALGGAVVGCLGLLDDHRSMGALFRFAVELAVAVIALLAGMRVHAVDIPAIDAFITIVWIVGLTNAVNLLDNMDGLAAGVTAAAGTAIFVLAVLGEQEATAVIAAALVGACLGFLVYNKRPASIFMGDAGSLFLGFSLAVLTIDVSPALQPPASFAVPLMLLALPILDTATVTIGRLRRRRSVALGGKDHLSHRLTARGLSPGIAVACLVAVEATVGMFAVLAGREVLPLTLAGLLTGVVLAGVLGFTASAPVYEEPVVGLPHKLTVAALAAVAGVLLVAAPAVLALARAHGPATAGADGVKEGLQALAAGDAAQATAHFEGAERQLRDADGLLRGRLASLGLGVPVLRANLATSRAVVSAGRDVGRIGVDFVRHRPRVDPAVGPGADPSVQASRLSTALHDSVTVLDRSSALLRGYDRPYLWPSLGSTVRQLRSRTAEALSRAELAAETTRLVPGLLGADGTRRYFLAVQDNSELRGSGGVVRFWGELIGEGGHLRLARFGQIDDLNRAGVERTLRMPDEFLSRYRDFGVAESWQNVNVSPDFPTTGQVVAGLYPQSGGTALDGVVAVDFPGLAALLDLTGPLVVDGWPEPVTNRTLVDIALRDSHTRYPVAEERLAFVAGLAKASVEAFTSADLGTPADVGAALGPAVTGGHLLIYATRPDEQLLGVRLGASGAVPGGSDDSVFVVNQNLVAAGLDAYLHRQIRYDINLAPASGSAILTGRLDVTLRNEASVDELPLAAIAPSDDRFTVGENRTYLSLYSTLSLGRSTLDGQPVDMDIDSELGRQAYSMTVAIPAQQSRSVAVDLRGKVDLTPDGWYRLDVLHQPSLVADDVEVRLSVPPGWRLIEARNVQIDDDRHASATLSVDGRRDIWPFASSARRGAASGPSSGLTVCNRRAPSVAAAHAGSMRKTPPPSESMYSSPAASWPKEAGCVPAGRGRPRR